VCQACCKEKQEGIKTALFFALPLFCSKLVLQKSEKKASLTRLLAFFCKSIGEKANSGILFQKAISFTTQKAQR
jgi:hypothetical protein